MSWATAIGGITSAFISSQAQKDQNKQNERLMREGWARDDKIRKETWERDDNATQRRMADLQKAGINPILAMGDPAGNTMPSTASQTTRMEAEDGMAKALEKMQTAHQIKMMKKQEELVEAQTTAAEVQAEATTELGLKYQNEATQIHDETLRRRRLEPITTRQLNQSINLLSADEKKSMLETAYLSNPTTQTAYQTKLLYSNTPLEEIVNAIGKKPKNPKRDAKIDAMRKTHYLKND